MENSSIKIRVNLNTREFEVEGDQDVVFRNFGDLMKDYLDIIKKDTKGRPNSGSTDNTIKETWSNDSPRNESLPDSFGEFYNKFPKNLSNVDKLLLACFYMQLKSDNKSFVIKDAADLLVEQGVKLSNPNAFNKSNIQTKKIFKLSGKNFRISDAGMDYIRSIEQSQ